MKNFKKLAAILSLLIFIGFCENQADDATKFSTKSKGLSSAPSIKITEPQNYATFVLGSGETQKSFTVKYEFLKSENDSSGTVVWYIDDAQGVVENSPDGLFNVTLGKGEHRITGIVGNDDGTPYLDNEGARDSIIVKIQAGCISDADCDDGNPCTKDSCVLSGGKKVCKYGKDSSKPGCCVSDFDCDFGKKCLDGNSFPDGFKTEYSRCAECSQDSDCGDSCKICSTDGFVCKVDLTKDGCCVSDQHCGNFPCEKCENNHCVDAGIAGCCTHVEKQNSNDKYFCIDPSQKDPCINYACAGNQCKTGLLYYGCCTQDSDCKGAKYAKYLSVCNSFEGQCVNKDQDGKGTCDFSNDDAHQNCCVTNHDCIKLLIDGKISGKSFPEWFGRCSIDKGGWKACEFYKNPNYCEVPQGVSKVVITEAMVYPSKVSDENGEWIELFNPGTTPIDLNNWYIGVENDVTKAHKISKDGGLIIQSGSFVVLGRNANKDENGGVKVDYAYGNAFLLDNGGGTIYLWDDQQNFVNKLTYSAGKVQKGYSVALNHPYMDGSDLNNVYGKETWARKVYGDGDHGTPGLLNTDIPDKNVPGFGYCDDNNYCTLDICNYKGKNLCSNIVISKCCATQNDPKCNDFNPCTKDSCNVTDGVCINNQVVANCCFQDSDCDDFYPSYLTFDYDVNNDGTINASDEAEIKARFDACVQKKCIAHRCRVAKKPDLKGCCIATDFPLKNFNCDDKNPCTTDVCECFGTNCTDGNGDTGYFKCYHDMTGATLAQNCDDNCPNVYNPLQIDSDKDGKGDACDPDDDNDGVPDNNDCAPYDPSVNPSAVELCDGKDNNCNGQTDEGFKDTNGDGIPDCYGSTTDSDGDGVPDAIDNCPGVPNADQADQDHDNVGDVCDSDVDLDGDGYNSLVDCDDNNPNIIASQDGICDNDNDGFIDKTACIIDETGCDCNDDDNTITSAADGTCDGDNDGYIDQTAGGNDCNDDSADARPDLTEICNDNLDNDCDGTVDENEENLTNCTDFYYEEDGDGYYADGAAHKCLCNSGDVDKYTATKSGDCDDNNPNINPGVSEVYNKIDDNCNGEVDEGLTLSLSKVTFSGAGVINSAGGNNKVLSLIASSAIVIGKSVNTAGQTASILNLGFFDDEESLGCIVHTISDNDSFTCQQCVCKLDPNCCTSGNTWNSACIDKCIQCGSCGGKSVCGDGLCGSLEDPVTCPTDCSL